MILRDALDELDQQKARMVGCTVEQLPRDEQSWRAFAESLLALEATLTWFDAPCNGEIGEIRVLATGWRYGISAMLPGGIAAVRAEIERLQMYRTLSTFYPAERGEQP